ncbi:ATP-binding protein [Listeria immobilis]|uniref:ATP-binding protein n=1 Tax=Listeria immobilis TaxID=2713502 RepID=UPI00164E9D64|nr:ATP-binding protein [Listeria immobilis]MBC6312004.1 ATP-binding protein [Listeria immobilis]
MSLQEKGKSTAGDFEKVNFNDIRFVENRTCNQCGNIFPVYERKGKETSICIHCDNKQIRQEMQKRHDETEKKRVFRIIERYSYVPDEIKSESFETFDPETNEERKALAETKEFIKNFPSNEKIIFQGKTGSGKTHLAYAAARELLKQGHLVLFVTVSQMLDSVRETFARDSEVSKSELINWYIKADLLILDDFGVETVNEKNREWVSEIVFNITNGRTDKPTIFTTNLKAKEIEAKYGKLNGQRIVSRMSKNARPIVLTGRDRRITKW